MSHPSCSEDRLVGKPEIGNNCFSEQPSSKPRNTGYEKNQTYMLFSNVSYQLKYINVNLKRKKNSKSYCPCLFRIPHGLNYSKYLKTKIQVYKNCLESNETHSIKLDHLMIILEIFIFQNCILQY